MAELKACPFCGGKEMGPEADPVWGDQVECDQCHARGPAVLDDVARAKELWNQRVLINATTIGRQFSCQLEGVGVVPGTVVMGDWLDDFEGHLRDNYGKGQIVATVDYATAEITPVEHRANTITADYKS